MKTLWMFICILLIALITAMFAAINTSPVLVHFVVVDTELPLIVIILGSTLLGGLIVGLIGMIKQFKLKRINKQLERQINELKKERAASAPVYSASVASHIEAPSDHPVSNQTAPH
ncbi:LapA family protein [Paenibacillus piri]|nr:LapA family protein [Paenibacillus piri]